MDAGSLPIPESVSQLELSVDRNLASLGRDDAVSVEAKLQVLLWGVRRHLNALSPINSLPPEMLAAIFRQVVSSRVEVPMLAAVPQSSIQHPHHHQHPTQKKIDIRPQFRLAHVCRRWRSTALGDASLWARVDVQAYPEAAVQFFLRCASGYPLTLHASAEQASLVDQILKDDGARIRAVYLNRTQVGDTSDFQARAARVAILQQLHPGAFVPGFLPGAAGFPLVPPAFNAVPAAGLPPGLGAPFNVNQVQGPPPIAAPFNLGGAHFPGPPLAGPGVRFNRLGGHFFDADKEPSSIFHHFCSYAPQLECFTLQDIKLGPIPMSSSRSGGGLSRTRAPASLPLKALALLLPEAYFPRNSFPNLTHMFLSFPLSSSQTSTQECTKSMLQMLSRTPQLQFLELSNLRALDATPDAFTIPLPRVSLDQLRLLAFSSAHLEVAFYLLKCLILPQPVLLWIDGSEGSNIHRNAQLHPSLRLPPIAPLTAATFMEISVDFHTLLLTGYDAQLTSSFLFNTLDFGGFWCTTWLRELHSMVPLSRIAVLHINDNGGRVLPHLLPYFTQLEELSILLLPAMQGAAGVVQTARALFRNLAPITTLVCPALRSLGLEAEIGDNAFPYTELQAMAVGRHQRGAPLRRFVYLWHGSAKPWSVAEAEERDKMSLVEAALAPLLQPYVDAVEFRLSSSREKPLCPFVPRECWRVQLPEAERYWRDKRPSYGMPWEKTGFADWDSARRRRLGERDDHNHTDDSESEDLDSDAEDFGLSLLAE
ncbi:hypothetical protein GSI_02059 [Ganoderma sinense ZZ0214-1]|uniref:Uncharacterized protein n=1 Tax=Ganoderma sinense ZZ0214-1 TaxID=1077348 RepID=A0A2G8SNI9_9APHY|nr:hypothetical protein GSI_02059 [Ganoderma sinense ZZ0214-1]